MTERLEGGVPPWTLEELQPLVEGVDALYLNFITGFEMGLVTAQRLRGSFRGPIYADLHSLFLGVSGLGFRFLRELPGWGTWLRAFDAVQMNEDEFALLGHAWGDPWQLAADAVGPELKLIAVTLGGVVPPMWQRRISVPIRAHGMAGGVPWGCQGRREVDGCPLLPGHRRGTLLDAGTYGELLSSGVCCRETAWRRP
jgi:hypothetical protein